MTQDELAAALDEHLAALETAAQRLEFVDLSTARHLHGVLREQLDRWADLTAHQRDVLAGAVDYLVRVDDDEDDVRSPIGLDDDHEVVEAAVREIRRG